MKKIKDWKISGKKSQKVKRKIHPSSKELAQVKVYQVQMLSLRARPRRRELIQISPERDGRRLGEITTKSTMNFCPSEENVVRVRDLFDRI